MKVFRVFTEGQDGELQISTDANRNDPTSLYDNLDDELHTADHANTPDQELVALKQIAALALVRVDQILNGRDARKAFKDCPEAKIIESLEAKLLTCGTENPYLPEEISIKYLLWMIEQMKQASYPSWDLQKINRWIGYIQGVMVARGLTTVGSERDRVRHALGKNRSEVEP